uniref:ubiquitinyl hydrolase 1 n=1 Tax=Anas platyrhynchos TaxID=8839 RepID=A0A8B9SSE1_ANAPL
SPPAPRLSPQPPPPSPTFEPPAPRLSPPAPRLSPLTPRLSLPAPRLSPPAPHLSPPAPRLSPPNPIFSPGRSLERLVLGQIVGFILNVPSHVSLGFVALPLRRKHWLAVRQLGGTYYNLDSKLRAPARIGGEPELRAFLRDFLAQGLCEVFLVVPRAVEEAGAWLSPE